MPLAVRALLVAALCLPALAASDATAAPRRYQALTEPPTDASRAVLVFVTDARYAVRAVVLAGNDGRDAASLELRTVAGEYSARAFALPPGRYRISALKVPDFQREPFEIHDAPPFELVAGQLNYIGDFSLYEERDDLMCRLSNRSGRLLTHLRERSSPLFGMLPFAFVGGDDDGWVGTLAGPRR